jgi:hypothetical protein
MTNTRDALGAQLGPYTEAGRDAIRDAQRLRDYTAAGPTIREAVADHALGRGRTYAGPSTNDPQERAKQSPMTQLAERLHEQASTLDAVAMRLSAVLERLNGPAPTTAPSTENNALTPGPGVLHVAQFGSQRIALQIERLNSIAYDLEQSI